jgi:hypothetical protein
MKEERKEALTQGCIDDDALKAYKDWTMYRVESREYAHLFERIQTYHHIGINDETIIKIDSNDELRSYILKNDRAYAIWLTQQKL